MSLVRSRKALLAGLVAMLLGVPAGCGGGSQQETLQQATRGFYAALNAMLAGNASPMLRLWSHSEDITYMSPFGQLLVGWKPVEASWKQQASSHLGGQVEPTDLHYFSSDGLGVVVGFERGTVTIDGKKTKVDIRATSTYRLEHGAWKMIGHHTDPIGS